jgi:hypothetical protein
MKSSTTVGDAVYKSERSDASWWATFMAVLDYLETKGGDIKFVTAEEIVDYYPK